MKQTKLLAVLTTIIMTNISALADFTCKGKVIFAQDNEPVIGATIKVDGTKTMTSSDLKGYFSFVIPDGAIIQVSYIGCESMTLKAKPNMGTIALEASDISLQAEYKEPTAEDIRKWVNEGYELYKKKDYKGAFDKWRDAALEGDLEADYLCALCYKGGIGCEKDLKLYVGSIITLAKKGHYEAQYDLGIMYRDGDGVPQNMSLAKEYLKKSADQGYNEAKIALYDLNNPQ